MMMDYTTQGRSPPSKKAKTKYPKVFQCSGYGDCKMTFTRSEHLARHIRKHTGERPFRCHCNRTFSRLDNLRQHIQTVHANEHHILHAPPPPPLPHSNKVPGQTEYIHRPPQPIAPAQQQYWTGPGAGHNKSQHIIIEHNPTSSGTSSPGQQQQFQDGTAQSQFRPRNNRPNPLSLDQKPSMNYGQDYKQSPTSPMFHLNSPQQPSSMSQAQYHQHIQQQQQQQSQQPLVPTPHQHQQPWLRNHYSQEQLPSLRNSRSSVNSIHSTHSLSQAYPPMPQQPSTPSAHHHSSEYPYQTNGFHSSPNLENHSHSHRSTVSSVSSKHLSASSAVTTPLTSNTNSWLSNVLCEPAANNQAQQDEDRPHTWGPTNNSSSQFDDHDRNSLSQLVRITEDAHISTPPNTTPGSEALPSLSALFSGNREQGLTPPQLGLNRSYTKNLILPRPDSYPPKGYALPMADTRPPALPPAGEQQQHAKSPSTPSSMSSSGRMNKPLPPLPAEAQRAEKERVDGINALIRAAGV